MSNTLDGRADVEWYRRAFPIGRPRFAAAQKSERTAVALTAGAVALAGVCVAVAAAKATTSTTHSPLTPPGAWHWAWIVGLGGAFVAYVFGVGALWRRDATILPIFAVAAALQLAPLAGPLLLSNDAYGYWAWGRIAAVHHQSPYAVHPDRFRDDPAYGVMGADWRHIAMPYGAGFALVADAHARVAGDSPRDAARLYRLLAAAGMLGLLATIGFCSARPAFGVALVGWSPLFALHFAGGGHNDVLMMLLCLAAVGIAQRRHESAGGGLWVGSASIKWVPFMLVPLWLASLRADRRRRALVGLGIGLAALGAVTFVVFHGGGGSTKATLSTQFDAVSSISVPYWLTQLGLPRRPVTAALLLAYAVVWVLLLRRAWQGRPRLALAAGLLLLAVPWLQPWYALWPMSLAALELDGVAAALGLALSAYFLRDALPL